MNKIFKVVWSRTIGSFVVTSELAKGRVKSSSEGAEGDVRASEEGRLKTLFRLTALATALMTVSGQAWAVTAGMTEIQTGIASESAISGGSATGPASIAIGDKSKSNQTGGGMLPGSRSTNTGAIAVGGGATAYGNNAISIGASSNATYDKAVAIGSDTIANKETSIALGGRAEATALGAMALGGWTTASGDFALAIGGSDRNGRNAVADGTGATVASGARSSAIGRHAKATGADAVAFGTGTQASGVEAVAIGKGAASTASKALAFGQGAQAQAGDTVAVGTGTQATGGEAVAIGKGAASTESNALALGRESQAQAADAVAVGANTQASGIEAVAIGKGAASTASKALAFGQGAQAQAGDSVAFGTNTRASGVEAVAIGKGAASTAAKALAFGQGAQAKESDTVAVGTGAQATLANSIAIGKNSVATGVFASDRKGRAIAIGFNTQALGEDSVAIGSGVDGNAAALAQNRQSVALGWQARATGTTQAVAIGPQAYASGAQSTSIGNNTRATGDSSIAIGGDDWDDAKKSVNAQYKALTGSDMSDGYQGTTSATAAVAVGVKAQATGALSTAFGPGTIASGLGASAFGVGASATQGKSVAIGAGSHTNTDATAVTTATVNGITYGGFAGTTHITSGSQVSFGSEGYERQLKHVAPGAITATSTDAINGSQLYALHAGSGNIAKAVADALGGGATVSTDPTNRQGTVTLPSYNVLKGSDTPNTVGNGTANFNATPARSVADALTNLNTYVNQGFTVKDNAGDAKGIVTPGESVQFADGNATAVTVDTEANGNTKIKYDVKVDDSTIKVVDGKLTGASQTHFYSVNSTDKTKANYNNEGATGENAIAAGPEAKAAANNAVVMGNKATVEAAAGSDPDVNGETTGESSVAVGSESTASGKNAVAIGQQANAYGENTFAGGQGAKALGKSSVAVGEGAKANERNTIAIGSGNNAWKIDSIALGRAANADGAASLALGLNSHTREANAIALGNNANADDTNSIAIGTNSKADQAAAIAIGNNVKAKKYSSVVIGEEAESNNSRSVVIGYYASATNPAMSASNQDTNQTVAIGAYANAWGDQSTAIGNNVDAKGNSSVAIGADDWDTVAVKTVDGTGGKTVKQVYQDYTGDVMETGSYTHTTSSEAAVAIGTKSQATGELSTAFGTGTRAEGVASAAFGMGAKATQGNSVAIGAGSTTTTGATSVNEATVNNLKYSGFAGGNSVNPGDQVSFGSKNYERQLKNVAPGEISNTSTDAINGSQLYAVQNVLGNTAKTVKDVLGGNAKLAEDGSITMSNIGNTGAGNIHDAIKSVKETAEKGWKLKANDEADSESEKIAAGDTVTVKQGKNIRVKRSSKELTIETADDVAFNKVTVGASELTTTGLTTPQVTAGDSVLGNNGLTIANGANPVSLTKDGLNNGGNKVTNIADGVADTDAASYKQVKAAKTEVQKGTNVVSVDKTEGTDGHAIYTVNAKGTAVSAEGTENGLKLTSSEDSTANVTTYNLDLSDKTKDSLKKADSALQNIGVQVNGEDAKTLNQADSKLNFVNGTGTTAENKNGTVTFNVNKSTLTTGAGGVVSADTAGDAFATAADVAKAINKAVVDSEKTSVVAAGDNTHVAAVEAGNQTTYTVHADNTTVSVKDGGKLALKSSEATNSNHTKTTNYELDLSDDTKAEIQKGVDAKNIVDTKGITFSGNSGSPVTKKLDETLAIKGDDTNVVTESGTDGITVKLKDEITVQTVNADKLKAGDSVLTNDGLNIANGNNPVSLTKSGLNNGGNKITKVAKGENEDDAVNYAQLKELAEKGLTFDADGNTSTSSKKLGERVGIKGGNNITTSADSDNVTVKLNDDITLNSVTATTLKAGDSTLTNAGLVTPKVTAGDSVLGNNGLTIANGANPVSLTKSGLDNGGNKVTNIVDGVADTDAASYKQVKAAKTEVQKGTNVVSVDKTEGTDGHAIYTVNAKGTAVSAEGTENGLKLTSSEDSTANVTTYNLDLSDKTKDSLKKADSALQNIGVQVNGEDAKTLNQADSKLNFVNGTGTTAENKNGTVTFNVNKSTLTTGAGGVVSADTAGDAFATAADVAKAINKAVVDSEKTSVVAAGDNTHVAAVEAGNQTTYTVHADNTTVSVKDGGKLALKSSEATNSNHTKTTNYELDLSDDTKAEIQKGVDAKNIVDTKGITFSGNSGSPVTKKLDETLAIKGDDTNVVTESGTDGITVKLKDEITVQTVNADKLKAGDSVLTNDGLNIANGNNPVSLTKSGLNNGGNKITKVAKGENEDDAVNYAQLKELAEKGLTFDADGNTSTSSKKLGERVGIKGGNNITTSADSDNVTVKLNDDITLNSVTATTLKAGDSTLTNAGLVTPKVTAGDSVLGNNGLNIANGAAGSPVSLTKSGLDNGGNKVTNVAKGTADTDAVNFSQLNPIAKALNTTVNPDGSIAAPNFTVKHADGTEGTPVHTVQDALDKVGEEVTKGINVGGTTGSNKYALGGTINIKGDNNIVSDTVEGGVQLKLADTVKIGQDSGKPVSIDGTTGTVSGLTNTTLGAAPLADSNKAATEAQLDATQVNLKNILGGEAKNENGNVSTEDIGGTGENNIHDAIKSVKATADKGWKLKANDEADSESEKIAAGDTVTVKQGKNIRVKRSGKDLTIETEDDVAFNKVTVGNSELTTTGLTTPKVTAGDSVLTTDGLNIANGAAGSPVSLTKDGLNNGGNKVTNVAKGTADTDGVNVSQLNPIAKALNTNIDPTTGEVAAPSFTVTKADGTKHPAVGTVQDALDKVGEEVTKGINVGGTEGSNKYALGDTVNIKGDSNIVSETAKGGVQLKLADTVKIGQDSGKPVSIDGTTGTVSGLTNTTLGAAPLADSNKAATEAQLDATQVNLKNILGGEAKNENGNVSTEDIGGTGENNIHDAIKSVKATADKGWKLKANDEADSESEKIAAGDTVTVKQGKNIRVKRSGKDLTIETEDDVAFNKVTVGNSELTTTGLTTPKVTAGDSVLTTDGLNIANGAAGSPVSLTKDGLNNGGNKVTNVAKGTADTDGVNVSQLNPIAKALNTNIDPTTGEVAAPSFTVTKADGTKHPAVGTVQDALDKVGEEVTKGLNIVADNGSSEKVNLGDTVKYTSKDKNIVTTSSTGKEIDFSLAEKVTIGKDAANGGKPVVIDGKEGIVSGLTNTTLGAAPLADSNKAATEAQLDATQVNLANVLGGNAANNNGNVTTSDIGGTGENNVHDAIKSVKATADKGWNLNANDETSSEKIGAGDTVTFKEGKNVKVSRNGKSITIATSDDVSFKTVTVGDSVLTDNGLTVGNGKAGKPVSLTKDGLNNGGNKIANVAAGEADTDAVNVAQLKAAAAKATSKVESGNDNIVVAPEQNADGSTTYKVATAPNLKADSFTAGDTVVNKDGVKVGDKVALGRDGLKAGDVNITADGINAGNKAISNVAEGKKDTDAVNVAQLKAAAAKATSKVESGNDNIVVTPEQNADGSTTYKVATAPDLKADSLTTGDTVVNNDGVKVGDKVALTKDGLDNGGNKVANVAAGEADTDAVNVAQLKAAAAKATSKVESGNDNIVVTPEQNADGSTTYKVATAPDLKADSLTTGDTVVNNDGVKVGDKVALGKDGLKAGDVNITANGISAGNKAISNVAEGKKDTDAVNVGQLNRLTAAAKTEVEAGTNIASVTSKKGKNGQTVYTVNADGASVSAGSDNIVVTKGNKDANNVTDYAVDLSKAVKDDIAKGVAAKDAVDNKGISFAGDSGTTVANKLGDTVAVKGDANITTTAGANGIQVGLNKDLKVDSVTTGGVTVNAQGISIGAPTAYNPANTVSLSPNGLNNGGQRITNVAPAKEGTDAVNLNQLVGMGNALQNNIANVGKKAYAGVAGAIAQGSIPQVTRPGATGIGVGSGYYGGQSAMAIGVSAMSDGGNWIVKGNFSANTDGHVGVGAGALYQW